VDWTAPDFDDTTWGWAEEIGPLGIDPWNDITGLSPPRAPTLPEADWMEGEGREGKGKEANPALTFDCAPERAGQAGWYHAVTPPGTRRLHVAVHGDVQVFVAGQELPVQNGAVDLPPDLQAASQPLALRVTHVAGCYGGAALAAPVTFDVGEGQMPLGSWHELGLPHYSGGVRYQQTVEVPREYAARHLWLDLGHVRGTAELSVNGRPVGVRLWRPYRFDVTGRVRPGENTFVVTVYNTLGPHFGAGGYPTPYVYPGQEVSGILGPVRLVPADNPPPPEVDTRSLVNWALAARGATARASSEHESGQYNAATVLQGETTGARWAHGGGWNDNTLQAYPDWLEIQLAEPRTVRAVKVYTYDPVDRYGLRDFMIQAGVDGEWRDLATIVDNLSRVIAVRVPPTRTARLRLWITATHGANDYSRVVAVEVWGEAE
jgi:hypothetical protein